MVPMLVETMNSRKSWNVVVLESDLRIGEGGVAGQLSRDSMRLLISES